MVNSQALQLGTAPSAIRALFEYGRARAAQVGRENIFDFSLGNPSIPAPDAVNEAINCLLRDMDCLTLHGYTSGVGAENARIAIAEDLNSRFDAGVTPGRLFLTCGAAPALTATFRALAVPGGELVVIAPYFPEYRPFAEAAGLSLRVVAADTRDFQIDFSGLAAAICEKTVAVLINSPNNPAGTVYTRQTLERLACLLREKRAEYGHPLYLISDEPYRELAYGVEVPWVPALYPDTVVCYSYAKSLSLPGERIGYVYVPEQATDGDLLFAAVCGAARSMGHVCAPSLLQQVIARCAHLRPNLQAYLENRNALYGGLTEIGYRVAKPDGAFYLFVEAPGGDANGFSEAAKKLDLLVVPGDSFGCPGWFRLCYCVEYDKIIRSLPLFRQLWDIYE